MSQVQTYSPNTNSTRTTRNTRNTRRINARNARRRIRSRGRANPRYRRGIRRQPALPASYGWSGSASANLMNRGGQAIIMSREIFPVTYTSASTLDIMIPMNPAQWIGTRTAQLASTFAAYRPTMLKIQWFNSTGTNTPGTISVGTVFAGTALNVPDRTAASGILPATNGGFITAIWRQQTTGVRLSTSLRANNFPTTEIQADDLPLWIVASFNGVTASDNTVLGNIVINARFSMYNPTMGNNYPSSSSSIRASIEHTDPDPELETPAASVLKIPTTSNISLPNIANGDDYWFVSGAPLTTTNDGNAAIVMQPIHGTYAGTNSGNHLFMIDPYFAAQAIALVCLIGKGANFMSRMI